MTTTVSNSFQAEIEAPPVEHSLHYDYDASLSVSLEEEEEEQSAAPSGM